VLLIDIHSMPWIAAGVVVTIHFIGLLHVLHALMNVRTSQGAVAWIISLLTLPYIAIPLYWFAGRNRFEGYIRARRHDNNRLRVLAHEMHRELARYEITPDDAFGRAAQYLGSLPFTRGNSLSLLIDGQETFESLFASIASAKEYILVNFFIVKSDRIGTLFQEALIERARAGVHVYFLFDEIGSFKLSRRFLRGLREAGVICHSFGTNRLPWSRLQVNFRNHRKIVVIDGRDAFLGGLNVGDEYLGRDAKFGAWRDTHLRLRGPSVQAVQLVFLEDWNWATDEVPRLHWKPEEQAPGQAAAIIPTGPADDMESWLLVVAEAANTSRQRLWITSPYFVPDSGVLTALQTAAIRGVDVRILLPEKADHLLVSLSAFSYYQQTIPYGVKLYRYQCGFLHQKVMLIDDRLACVGSANLDNRSFRLNFEITALSHDPEFVSSVTRMLETDFSHANKVEVGEFTRRPFLFRAACRAARLLSPIQ
jgi:cardiolipin synthase